METTVDERLDFVMQEIRAGASPWRCKDADIAELREHYRPGFEATRDNWDAIKDKLIRLARYQGALAALLAEAEVPQGPAPAWIERKWLFLASFIVQVVCPQKRGLVPFGDACPLIRSGQLDMAAGQQAFAWLGTVPHPDDAAGFRQALGVR